MQKKDLIRKDFLIFGKPKISQDEIDEVVDSLKSGWISTGQKVKNFEKKLENYLGIENVCATSSCTAALHLSLLACGIGKGDEIITTAMTFTATANVIEHVGAKPVFVDVEENGYNIDVAKIEEKITNKTKAIIPVHFAGYPCELDKINKIAGKYNLYVIEDAAHAFGTKYKGKFIGDSSNFVCFSFYVTKNLCTGEGGMVVCPDIETENFVRVNSLHGMSKDAWKRFSQISLSHYDVTHAGYKYNMQDINAAIGIHQLNKIDNFTKLRREIADYYFESLNDIDSIDLPFSLREELNGNFCTYHLFPIIIKNHISLKRDEIMSLIMAENVGVAIHYHAVYEHSFYKRKYKINPSDYPNSKRISDYGLSLPMSNSMSISDAEDVVKAIKKIMKV